MRLRIQSVLHVKELSDQLRIQNAQLESKVRERTRVAEDDGRQLRAERDHLRDAFNSLEEAFVLLDSVGEILEANPAGQRLLDSNLKKTLSTWAAEVGPIRAPQERELVDGARVWLGRAYQLSGQRALLYLRDVTESREGEVRRLQAEKLVSIGMLAAGVAHEINNPAAFVMGNFEAMSAQLRTLEERLRGISEPHFRKQLDETLFEAAAMLQESKEGMARIHRIVRDLSSFSHVDDDQIGLTDINSAVDSTLSLLRNELRHRATVDRDLQSTRLVRTTSAKLGQVFLNLIMNAVQAVDEARGKENRIRVRTYDRGNDVIFEVRDNGPGIGPDVLPRIFDSFFTTKPRGIGTGLGLPISQGIVNALGGEISVQTQLGIGTRFRVSLPSEPSARTEASSAVISAVPVYTRRRILAVDDEALLLKAYRRMIGDVHEVVTALGGRDALLILRKRQDFDVILCDLQMPEISGMELFMTAKKEFPELAERFVFVTGGAFSAEARQFLEQAVTCLNKPFRVDELLALVDARPPVSGPQREAPSPEGERRQRSIPEPDPGRREEDLAGSPIGFQRTRPQ